MSISFSQNALIASPGAEYSLASLIKQTAGSLPEYLVVTGMDHDRYTVSSNGDRGTLAGNGHTLPFNALGLTSAFGAVFTHTAQGYYNSTYGYLSDLKFKSSTDNYRSEYLSLYGFGSAGTADAALAAQLASDLASPNFDGTVFMTTGVYRKDAIGYSAANYLGSLDVVTRSGYMDTTPNAATPDEIVAVAKSFSGGVWNDNGCWVLVSNIAAAAGATLPLTAARARPEETPPLANGQWFVAYNSVEVPAAQQKDWISLMRPGDMVLANNTCGGHIATVVEGFGNGARIIDNGGAGYANDGSDYDVLIGPAHRPRALTFANDPGHVVIYRLDAPLISELSPLALNSNASAAIGPLVSVSDPRGGSIVSYQLYDTNPAAGGAFVSGATARTAHTPETAISVAAVDFAAVRFAAGAATGSDSIMVRAYNGRYWGDWQDIPVDVGSAGRPAVLTAATSEVKLHGGESVMLSSLISTSSPDSPISYYNVVDPGFGGSLQLNGATTAASRASSDGGLSLDFLPAEFSKLGYLADSGVGGEMLTITAHNASPLASVPLSISMATVAPSVHGISHAVAPGQQLPLSAMFAATLADGRPIVSYTLSTDVLVISWGPYLTPSSGGTVLLNGATNLLPSTPLNYQVAAADLDKVSYVGGSANGSEALLLSSSADLIHWTAEKQLAVMTTGVQNGGAGDDQLAASSGNERFQGGAGLDAVVYAGERHGFAISRAGNGGVTVTDQVGDGGRDTLSGVERIKFSDMTVNLTIQAKAAAAPAADLQHLTELYLAFFNRVPDADGLAYWIDQLSAGQSIDQIAESFYDAGVQYSSLTGFSAGMSNQDFINLIYKNALGRSGGADQGGLDYWNGELASGHATHGSLVFDILSAAHTFKHDPNYSWVADLLDNKLAVADKFAIDLGLNYNTANDSITRCMAIAAAVTATSTAEAIALVGIPGV